MDVLVVDGGVSNGVFGVTGVCGGEEEGAGGSVHVSENEVLKVMKSVAEGVLVVFFVGDEDVGAEAFHAEVIEAEESEADRDEESNDDEKLPSTDATETAQETLDAMFFANLLFATRYVHKSIILQAFAIAYSYSILRYDLCGGEYNEGRVSEVGRAGAGR